MKTFAFILVLFIISIGFAQQPQIIAVAAVDRTGNSQISQKAGRAPYYLIFNQRGKLMEVISNPFSGTARRAGPQVAALLAEKNITVMVAGEFGHKLKIALDEKGIYHHVATGVVKRTVQELLE